MPGGFQIHHSLLEKQSPASLFQQTERLNRWMCLIGATRHLRNAFHYIKWKETPTTVYLLNITIKRKNPSELQSLPPRRHHRSSPSYSYFLLKPGICFFSFFPFLNLNSLNYLIEFLLTISSQFFLSQSHNENTARRTLQDPQYMLQ